MNIFYLDRDPVKAAQIQYNKHVVKMVLESAQMLCTAHRYYGNDDVPYKSAHVNHPSSIWCRENSRQYYWLFDHMLALGNEYTKRYGKKHLSITKCFPYLQYTPVGMPLGGQFTEPPQCMPDEYKVEGDSISAYWNYYEQEKQLIKGKNEQKIIRPINIKQLQWN
jgi:hypothetical protein